MPFFMADSTDHQTGKTGLSPTVTISKNSAGFGSPSGAVSEIGNGWYSLAGNATDRGTLGSFIIHATAAGADATDTQFRIVPWDPYDAVRMGLTALPNVASGDNGAIITAGSGTAQLNVSGGGAPLSAVSYLQLAIKGDASSGVIVILGDTLGIFDGIYTRIADFGGYPAYSNGGKFIFYNTQGVFGSAWVIHTRLLLGEMEWVYYAQVDGTLAALFALSDTDWLTDEPIDNPPELKAKLTGHYYCIAGGMSQFLDAAVSSRLATGGYTAPLTAQQTANALKLAAAAGDPAGGSALKLLADIAAKTVNIPADPAAAGDVQDLATAVGGLATAVGAIPTTAAPTKEQVQDGLAKTEDVQTAANTILARLGGSGSVIDTFTIQKPDRSGPLAGCDAWVTADEAGTAIVAGVQVSDSGGEVAFHLDPTADGEKYWLQVQLSGYEFADYPEAFTVSSEGFAWA